MAPVLRVRSRSLFRAIVAGAALWACTEPNSTPVTVTATLTATPTTVPIGGSATLTWSSTNAADCTAGGGWSGTKATSGTASTGPLTTTTSFTLTCNRAGGSATATASVTVTPVGTSIFPLHVDAGKHYLLDAQGQPFLLRGDAAWSLMVQLTNQDAALYLEDRRQKGFNAVLANLIEHQYAANPPNDVYGDGPFLTPGDFSTPNEAYFAHAEYVINLAAQKGMLVVLAPAYMGYNGGSQGWYQEMVANGTTKLANYGTYLANRFRAYDNILWVQGCDYNPPDLALLRAIPNAIRAVDTKWLQTFDGVRGTSALGFLGTAEPWVTVNEIYSDQASVMSMAFREYGRSPMPFFLIEAQYEGEGATEAVVRQQAYQAVLSGASGQIMGNDPIWLFGSGWQQALNSRGAVTLANLPSLLAGRAWWSLVPDVNNTVLTAGVSSGADQAATARASDGSFVVTYLPSARDVTVNLSQLAGPHVVARWYDPASGAFQNIAGSPFSASGPQLFPSAGSNSSGYSDWILLLESAP
jgi:uncharacterized protein DUF4038/collagenase-like protein with putative collagen-binding domain